MLIGSVLLHALLLAAFYLFRPETPGEQQPPADEIALEFEAPSASQQASTQSTNPTPSPNVAAGNEAATATTPSLDTTPPAAAPPPEQTPPTPEAPTPSTAEVAPATPPTPQPPPTVSLHSDEADLPPPTSTFQMPEPPPPLPPLPRPAPPRVARTAPRNSSAFPTPQNWSFNAQPSQRAPGHASRGFDMSTSPLGGSSSSNQSLSYVSGARPSGDWMSELRKWIEARVYYPEQAVANGEDGVATVFVTFDRSGKVLSVKLVSSSHSQFLDGAWLDVFRRATVPPFTPDMTEDTTTLTGTLTYRLIRH